MKRYILFIVFALALVVFVEPVQCKPLHSDVIVEGGAIMGNALPRFGIVGENVEVRGRYSYDARPLYTLHKGQVIRLHEQMDGWVMIAPAEWIPLRGICGY